MSQHDSKMTAALPKVRMWERDPDAATPECPCCKFYLGIRRAMFTEAGRDVWFCDQCDKEFDA